LFQHQENESGGEDDYRNKGAVVPGKTMKQGVGSNKEGKADHCPLKECIVNDVDAENGQAAGQYGQ